MSMNRIPPEGALLKREVWSPVARHDVPVLGIYMGCHARMPRPHVVFWFWPSALGDAPCRDRNDEQTLMLFSRA